MAQSALSSIKRPSAILATDGDITWYGVGEPLVFQGHYTVQVVKGAVELAGVTLAASPTIHCVSAPLSPYFAISSTHALQNTNSEDAVDLSHLENAEQWLTIVKIDKSWSSPDLSALAPPFKSLWTKTSVVERPASSAAEIASDWRDFALHLPRNGASVLILGPKNAGKSTLAKFLVNTRASSTSSDNTPIIYYLELDPGQCEFCAPGTLSLHILRKPIFTPAWAHPELGFDPKTTIKAHSLGYVSPIETPQRYLEMCADLIQTWRSQPDSRQGILIVNTPGWTNGLGLELNVAVARLLDPSHIVHVGDEESSLSGIERELGNETVPVKVLSAVPYASNISASSTPGPNATSDPEPNSAAAKYSASDMRTLQTLTYLHSNDSRHLTEWSPYELTDQQIHLAVLDSDGIEPEDFLMCLEGTLVSVLLTPCKLSEWILSPQELNEVLMTTNCVGYGVIQSINAKKVRLLVPFDPDVTIGRQTGSIILCRGRLALPIWALWKQGMPVDGLPWITERTSGVGGVYKKFRRNLKR